MTTTPPLRSEAAARSRKARLIARAFAASGVPAVDVAAIVARAKLSAPVRDQNADSARARQALGLALILASRTATVPCPACGGGYTPDCGRCDSTGAVPDAERRTHPWVDASVATWELVVEMVRDEETRRG